jgi:hypothetical protein
VVLLKLLEDTLIELADAPSCVTLSLEQRTVTLLQVGPAALDVSQRGPAAEGAVSWLEVPGACRDGAGGAAAQEFWVIEGWELPAKARPEEVAPLSSASLLHRAGAR